MNAINKFIYEDIISYEECGGTDIEKHKKHLKKAIYMSIAQLCFEDDLEFENVVKDINLIRIAYSYYGEDYY